MKSEFEETNEHKNRNELLLGFVLGICMSLTALLFIKSIPAGTEDELEPELTYGANCLDSPFYGELVRYNDELYYDDVTKIFYFWDGKSPRHEATPCYSWNGLPYSLRYDETMILPATLLHEVEDAVRVVVKEVIAEEKALQETEVVPEQEETETVQEVEIEE